MESEMRQIVFAAATVATLFASPALAQSFSPEIGSGNIVSAPGAGSQTAASPARNLAVRAPRATDAFAQGQDFRGTYHWPVYDSQGRDRSGW
jgi:hypothetical protein